MIGRLPSCSLRSDAESICRRDNVGIQLGTDEGTRDGHRRVAAPLNHNGWFRVLSPCNLALYAAGPSHVVAFLELHSSHLAVLSSAGADSSSADCNLAMALTMGSPVTGPSFALSTEKCSTIQLWRARSMPLPLCPLPSHIKQREAKHVSHAAVMGPMPQPSINVLSSRHHVRRLLLNASSCSFCPPSGCMVRVEVRPASVESEGQSSQGTAEKHLGVLDSSEAIVVSGTEPIVDASNLDKPAKRCSACGFSKLLVDFKDTVSTEDKRTEVCRACLAVNWARCIKGRELYHLELTPEQAWERAKICKKCGVRKEIRDFCRRKASKDGTFAQCRSCKSNYEKARPAVLPVDTPQRCIRCNEMKPAADYFVNLKKRADLSTTCKLCHQKLCKERYLRLKHSNIILQRQDKICTNCGQLKLASDFKKHAAASDGLGHLCKSCDRAQSNNRYHERKAKETGAGPPSSQ
jgi:hypothetical protein